jgi:tetratricopeptide (TPR) repeat protein
MRARIILAIAGAAMIAGVSAYALNEESIPGADLPTPTATPSPAAGTAPVPTSSPMPAASPTPTGDADTDNSSDWRQVPTAADSDTGTGTPEATPSEIPAAIDVGSVAPSLNVSDAPLTPLIDASSENPARGASLRMTEAARALLLGGHPDDAIRDLSRAISIDPTNAYAYLYVGRAYLEKKNYDQAMTFLKHAEVGMGADSAWLGETLAYEGLTFEESGKPDDAAQAFQRAIAASPGNLTARVGQTRVTEIQPAPTMDSSASPTDTPTPTPVAN